MDGSGQQPVDAGVSNGPPKLFDPNVGDTARLRAQAATNEGPSKVVGKADGQTKTGQLRTPLSAALPRYSRRAAAASHSPSLTPSERSLVKSYFEQLQQAANPQPAVNSKQAVNSKPAVDSKPAVNSKPAAPSNPATAPSVPAKKGNGS